MVLRIFFFSLFLPYSIFSAPPSFNECLEQGLQSFDSLKGYKSVLKREEKVRGRYLLQTNIIYKYKKPMSLYLKIIESGRIWTEGLYVAGENGDKVLITASTWAGKFNLNVPNTHFLVMNGNRHALNDSHMGVILHIIETNYRKMQRTGLGSVQYLGERKVGNRMTWCYQAVYPENRGYYSHISEIYWDQQYFLPVRTRVFGWKQELWEDYRWVDLIIDPEFSDLEFSPDNPQYNFPGQ